MSDRLVIHQHEAIHGVDEIGVDDALLPLMIEEVVQDRGDTADKSLTWYAVRRNGSGTGRWIGHKASLEAHQWAMDLVRHANRQLSAATGGTWLVALTDWNPARMPSPCYDSGLLAWKDRDGDIPFTVEFDMGRLDHRLSRRDGLLEVAWKAWVRYAEQLLEAGIKAEQTSRFALGERSPVHH